MQIPHVPQDDLVDVMEMTQKLENYISSVLKDNERDLALSALISASINCMLAQCKTLNDAVTYRDVFISILDNTIRSAQIKPPEK